MEQKLKKMIQETGSGYAEALSDDDLSFVSAAGEPSAPAKKTIPAEDPVLTGETGPKEPCFEPASEQLYKKFLEYQQEQEKRTEPVETEYETEYQKYLKWLQEQNREG